MTLTRKFQEALTSGIAKQEFACFGLGRLTNRTNGSIDMLYFLLFLNMVALSFVKFLIFRLAIIMQQMT